MADPVTLAMGATAVGAGVGAFGSWYGGQASKNMYQYQSAVSQINKQISDQNAKYAIAAGETRAQESGMKTRAEIGTTRAIQGASGLDVNRGSAVEVRASEADIGTQSAAVIRSNAAREAYGYKVQGFQYGAQSKIDIMAGKNAAFAGNIGAVSSILGGASSVSSKWLQGSQAGMFGGGSSSGYDMFGSPI
jgi:hypothetical protein